MSNHTTKIAKRAQGLKTSVIRELLKALNQKDMISLAGGAPAPESFAVDVIRELHEKVLTQAGSQLLQYGTTEGYEPLQNALAKYLMARGIKVSPADIGISTGAQTALDALAKVLIDADDLVAVEAPTFLGALKTFRIYEPRLIGMPMGEDGLEPASLARAFEQGAKFAYLIPNYQNPTGHTLSLAKRYEIAEILKRYNGLIVEDDPYYELCYEQQSLPTIKSLAPEHVIYVGSFSKVLAPGLRLGYYVAPTPLGNLITSVRQGMDVHANQVAQAVAAEYLSQGLIYDQLLRIQALYRPRLAALLQALTSELPVGFSWSHPTGGMFVWVTGPHGFDAVACQQKALEKGVAFVPGEYFYADSGLGQTSLRLTFATCSESLLFEGIQRIAKAIKEG